MRPHIPHCSACERNYEPCSRCAILGALRKTRAKMIHAAGLLVNEGGECADLGRELRAAAQPIDEWMSAISAGRTDSPRRSA